MLDGIHDTKIIGGGMFNQQNGQDNQQPMQDVNAPGQPAPANDQQATQTQAPAPDQQMSAPQPAYESIFDDDHTTNDGSLTSDDQQAAPTEQQPAQAHITPTDAPQQAPATSASVASDDDLLNIKKQALEQLSPLVGKLEQNPEEKFHTTMRIIQASDNHSLLKEAYDAAQKIPDEKARAQALLDIVNEINYFTKEDDQQPPQEN